MNWHGWLAKSGLKPAFSYAFYVISYLVMMWLTYAHFADLIFQKGSRTRSFFNMFKWKSSSRYSIVHILSTSSSKSAPSPSVFLTFSIFKWKKLSTARTLQSRTLLSTSSSKSAPDPTIFTFFNVKSSSRYSLVHLLPTSSSKIAPGPSVLLRFLYETEPLATVLWTFCGPLSPIEPRTCGNRDPPSATTAATIPEKIQGFAPESVFKPEFTRSELSQFRTTCMMMWLPWWLRWPSWRES